MMPLIQLQGANPVALFDTALNAAHSRASAGGQLAEPYFVRELISNTTIRALNTAAANSYDENLNVVRFRGGFLHSRPWAVFDALDSLGNKKIGCTRELADALLVFHLTEPDGTGAHKIVRRAACLLMFKMSHSASPTTPSFIPLGAVLPNNTDQEQFYLFNQWPEFDLKTSKKTKIKGKGNYLLAKNSDFSFGKYSLVWDGGVVPPQWSERWRYAAPIASVPVTDSLGSLLGKLVDSHKTVGEIFTPTGTRDWDFLLKDLLQYAETKSWKGSRNANPAGLSFLSHFEKTIENLGTCMQHARLGLGPDYDPGMEYYYMRHFHHSRMHEGYPNINNEINLDGMPIIFATATSFKSPERRDAPSLQARKRALLDALRSLR